jgi:prepilin-type N-terminal cleavage/methylation domain-containing protein
MRRTGKALSRAFHGTFIPFTFSLPAERAFTLIELILVLALLVIITSLAAPAMSNFIRGRALDSEARRLLALMHAAQSRAVSEGAADDAVGGRKKRRLRTRRRKRAGKTATRRRKI